MSRFLFRVRAGLAASAVAVLVASCGGDSATEPAPTPQPAQVQVAPSSATLTSIGATQQFSATVRDGQGNVMSGASVTWTSLGGTVASVSTNGLVEAVGEGTATIRATSGTVSGEATVTVQLPAPVAASVEVTPAAVTLTSAGATQALTAVVRDAQGAEIPGAAVSWSSSADGVATVSPEGVVTAVGSGSATIAATSGQVQGQAQVTVDLPPAPFVTTWQVESDFLQITIPTTGGGYNYTVHWVNTDNPAQNGTLVNQVGNATFNVPEAGLYRVEISGQFPRIYFLNVVNFVHTPAPRHEQIRTVEQWGDIAWTSMEQAFRGTLNLNVVATDAPDLTNVTSLRAMFFDAPSMNGPIGHWKTDNVTNTQEMFRGAKAFNQPIDYDPVTGAWNVGNVTSMEDMFREAEAFNQDLDGWDVGQVTSMRTMFRDATAFNGDIGSWNTSNVTTMNQMFDYAVSFNRDISGWDVSNVTQFGDMFEGAASFNQDIGGWDTGSGTSFTDMFRDAADFDQDLGGWNIGSATSFSRFFDGSGMSVANYDATLMGWAAFVGANAGPNGRSLNSGNLRFCESAAARQSLIQDHAWTIVDGGVAPGCFPAGGYWVVAADRAGGGPGIATSPDGDTWTARTAPFDDQVRDVVWNGSLWVAMGRAATMIATSPDGETWTARTSPFTTEGIAVGWGNGLWVAGGRGGATLATSTNGINWTPRSSPVNDRVRGIAWNGSLWVAVGRGTQTIATSPDGITWTGRPSILTDAYDVAWNGSLWVVAGEGGASIVTSPDGVTWTPRTSPLTTRARGVAWNGSLWLAGGVGASVLATSPDGVTWTGIASPLDQSVRGLGWNGTHWMIPGRSSGGASVAYSSDLENWTEPVTPFTEVGWRATWGGVPGLPSGGF